MEFWVVILTGSALKMSAYSVSYWSSSTDRISIKVFALDCIIIGKIIYLSDINLRVNLIQLNLLV